MHWPLTSAVLAENVHRRTVGAGLRSVGMAGLDNGPPLIDYRYIEKR
jgi:hypothetical protein